MRKIRLENVKNGSFFYKSELMLMVLDTFNVLNFIFFSTG